jgi:hypothetical protein
VPDAGALLVDGVAEPEAPPEAGGAGVAVAGDEVAAGTADESDGAVVVAVGVGFGVSPVGGFILSE